MSNTTNLPLSSAEHNSLLDDISVDTISISKFNKVSERNFRTQNYCRKSLVLSLYLLYLVFGALPAYADRSPDGCLGSGLNIALHTSANEVQIGETISYSVDIFNTAFPSCDATSIHAEVITPDGVTHSIPLTRTTLLPEQSDSYGIVATYLVTAADVPANGALTAFAFVSGVIHQNITNSTGGGNQSVNTSVVAPIIQCESTDQTSKLLLLDNYNHEQAGLIRGAGKALVRHAPSRRKAHYKQITSSTNTQADKLYSSSWIQVWSVSKVVTLCSGAVLCTASDVGSVQIAGYMKDSEELLDLMTTLTKGLRKVGRRAQAKKIQQRSAALFESSRVDSLTVLTTQISCF